MEATFTSASQKYGARLARQEIVGSRIPEQYRAETATFLEAQSRLLKTSRMIRSRDKARQIEQLVSNLRALT